MHKKVIIPSPYSQITYQGTCSLIPRVYLFFWALMHVFHFVSLQTYSTHSTYIHVVPSNIPSYFNNVLHRFLYLWTNERTKVNKIHCTFVISFDRSRSFDTQTHSFVSWNNNPYSIHISVIYIPSNKYLFFYVCKIVYMHASSYFITHYCNLSYHRDFPCLLRACEPVVWYGIPVLREANKRIACALVTHSFALLHQIIQKDREQISHENLNTFRLTFI